MPAWKKKRMEALQRRQGKKTDSTSAEGSKEDLGTDLFFPDI